MLTHLHLIRCTGPFGDELGVAFASREAVLPLQELHLQGGASALSDPGLAQCLSGWVRYTSTCCRWPCSPLADRSLDGLPVSLSHT